MSFGLPNSLDLDPLRYLIDTADGQLWTAVNGRLSLEVTPSLKTQAKQAFAHLRSVNDTYREHYARLVEVAVELLPENEQEMVVQYFDECAPMQLVPLGHLHLLAFTDHFPDGLLRKGPDEYLKALEDGWRALLKAARVPSSYPDLFATQPKQLDLEAIARFYTIRGLLQDWEDYTETHRKGWLKGKLVPVVTACADELCDRLQSHLRAPSRFGHPAPFDPTSACARKKIGDAVFQRLDLDDTSLPDFSRVGNLMAPNEDAQVFNKAVVLLILRNS